MKYYKILFFEGYTTVAVENDIQLQSEINAWIQDEDESVESIIELSKEEYENGI